MNPKITIILPTYNRKILLRRALNSIPLSKDWEDLNKIAWKIIEKYVDELQKEFMK